MTTPAYPFQIRSILRASKSRSQPAAFRLAEPRRGYGYAQASGTDVPVFWDVAFRFDAEDALLFQLWFDQITGKGVREFTMPIRTEFGYVTHTCRFLPDSLVPATENGQTWGYTATIMARRLIVPPEWAGAGEMILGLPRWREWLSPLDVAVNSEMPQPVAAEYRGWAGPLDLSMTMLTPPV